MQWSSLTLMMFSSTASVTFNESLSISSSFISYFYWIRNSWHLTRMISKAPLMWSSLYFMRLMKAFGIKSFRVSIMSSKTKNGFNYIDYAKSFPQFSKRFAKCYINSSVILSIMFKQSCFVYSNTENAAVYSSYQRKWLIALQA